ncbi:MAG: hypothetical protein J5517_05915 [Eubacterium sp.]|nr:hypothetical protein [Eubacterium sp.]
MSSVPEYIEDYLKIIKTELKDKYNMSEEEAAKAVYKSAVRSILCGDDEEMRRFQMHKSIDETVLDVYRQYKNIGQPLPVKNGEDEVFKILQPDESVSMRSRHKEKLSALQDIPLKLADD